MFNLEYHFQKKLWIIIDELRKDVHEAGIYLQINRIISLTSFEDGLR